jgi:hypothetical protein
MEEHILDRMLSTADQSMDISPQVQIHQDTRQRTSVPGVVRAAAVLVRLAEWQFPCPLPEVMTGESPEWETAEERNQAQSVNTACSLTSWEQRLLVDAWGDVPGHVRMSSQISCSANRLRRVACQTSRIRSLWIWIWIWGLAKLEHLIDPTVLAI